MIKRTVNILKSNSFLLFGARGVGKTKLIEALIPAKESLLIDLLDPEQYETFSLNPRELFESLNLLGDFSPLWPKAMGRLFPVQILLEMLGPRMLPCEPIFKFSKIPSLDFSWNRIIDLFAKDNAKVQNSISLTLGCNAPFRAPSMCLLICLRESI